MDESIGSMEGTAWRTESPRSAGYAPIPPMAISPILLASGEIGHSSSWDCILLWAAGQTPGLRVSQTITPLRVQPPSTTHAPQQASQRFPFFVLQLAAIATRRDPCSYGTRSTLPFPPRILTLLRFFSFPLSSTSPYSPVLVLTHPLDQRTLPLDCNTLIF